MELRQRTPRQKCEEFLRFVRRRPCCACGAPAPSQAAHLRITDPRYSQKRHVGIGEKPDDSWTTPLCAECHLDAPDAQHRVGEPAFWARVGIDPFKLADRLWRQFCRRKGRDPDLREAVTKRAARMSRKRKNRERKSVFTQSPIIEGDGRLKRGAVLRQKSKVSAPIRSRGFTKGPKRKWPSRPFNRENRDGAPRR